MSGYKNFAIVGAGVTGNFIVRQFLKDKAAGTINEVVVLTRQVSAVALIMDYTPGMLTTDKLRQGSKTTIEGDAKVIPVDYSDKESIKGALVGIDVVISTISATALGLQPGIAKAAKEAGVKLFIPSEFGGPTEGATEGLFGAKAGVQDQLKAVGIPYALIYTGPYADNVWGP
jgi:uncharacterized protein YbjT (DUF2867 family)